MSDDTPSGNADPARRYIVIEAEQVEMDRESAYLRFLPRGPNYAAQWAENLIRLVQELPNFPGPLSHAIDFEASAHFGYEVRRILYYGPTRRRSGTPYRVLFTLLAPDPDTGEIVIRVLRILHGAQQLGGADATHEPA